MASSVEVRAMDDAGGFPPARAVWDDLLAAGDTDTVFLTWDWQRLWWASFGRGTLLPLVAERDGTPVALAPLFADAGMVFFVGSGGSDYLDFIGDVSLAGVLPALLEAARERTEGFEGFRFYHVPDASRTGSLLQDIAPRLGLRCFDEGALAAPQLVFPQPGQVPAAAAKRSLLRHEAFFRREGALEVRHLLHPADITQELPAFMAQHVERWAVTDHPSLFLDPAQRDFYQRLAAAADSAGWLRFTRVAWNGEPIAFHLGFARHGTYLWYKPSFAIALARRSPGEVLLRHLLLAAASEGCHTFDFGLGDETFKRRFATAVPEVRTWGLYP